MSTPRVWVVELIKQHQITPSWVHIQPGTCHQQQQPFRHQVTYTALTCSNISNTPKNLKCGHKSLHLVPPTAKTNWCQIGTDSWHQCRDGNPTWQNSPGSPACQTGCCSTLNSWLQPSYCCNLTTVTHHCLVCHGQPFGLCSMSHWITFVKNNNQIWTAWFLSCCLEIVFRLICIIS